MKINQNHWLTADPAAVRFFLLAMVCIVVAVVLGMVVSLKLADYGFALDWIPFQRLRPLHTFFSISAVISGLLGLIATINRDTSRSDTLSQQQFLLMTLFIVIGAVTLAMGITSGREYISWHPALSVLLFGALAIASFGVFRNWRLMARRSPESSWLIGFGSLFILGGLIESHLWLWPSVGYNSVRDLTVQWHGLDIFFAGLNAALYGCAIQITTPQTKSLRGRWLFVIATVSLLFTFGHHHYASPQPDLLKTLSFLASMLAMVSFVRHLRATLQLSGEPNHLTPLLKAVETWTLVAAGSGILLAIPYINTVFHGTYAVVVHAMGSMIGVNLMIILAGGFAFVGMEDQVSPRRIYIAVKLINYSLTALWVLFMLTGLAEGVLRTTTDYLLIYANLQPLLAVLPVIGLALMSGVLIVCLELSRICRHVLINVDPQALSHQVQDDQ